MPFSPSRQLCLRRARRRAPRRASRQLPSPGTSRRSCSAAVRTATGPSRSRRCRSSPTKTCGRGRARSSSAPGIGRKPGVMPPWYIEKNIGIQQFKDDLSLSDEEIAKIAQVGRQRRAARQPRRHAAAAQVRRCQRVAHRHARPDREVARRSTVKATAPDWWGEIGESPTGLTEDRYVSAVEIKEVNDFAREDFGQRRRSAGATCSTTLAIRRHRPADGRRANSFGGWPVHEVGRNADVFDPTPASLLQANSSSSSPRSTSTRTAATRRRTWSSASSSSRRATSRRCNVQPLFARQRSRHRHPRHGSEPAARRVLHAAAAEHEDHHVRAAPARARRADVPRGDLGHQHPDAELRRLQPQLGARLQLRGRCRAAAAEGHDPPHHRLHRQLAGEQERARIRATGRARATARSPTC